MGGHHSLCYCTILMNRFGSGKSPCLCPERGGRQVFLLLPLRVGVGQLWSGADFFLLTHGGMCHPFPSHKARGLICIPTIPLLTDHMIQKLSSSSCWPSEEATNDCREQAGLQHMVSQAEGRGSWGCPFPSSGPCFSYLLKTLSPSETPS